MIQYSKSRVDCKSIIFVAFYFLLIKDAVSFHNGVRVYSNKVEYCSM